MKENELIKYKSILIDILVEFDRVCNQHGLSYFLIGGSLLGAIRHKGMIPWDDDIDVAMPRKDYEKLKDISKSVFNEKYELVHHKSHIGYYKRFAKLQRLDTTLVEDEYPFFIGGINIDVFAFDGLPNSFNKKEKHLREYERCWYKLYNLYSKPDLIIKYKNLKEIFRNLRKFFYHKIYSIDYLVNKCESIAQKYEFEDSEEIINFQGGWGRKEIGKRVYFDGFELANFEGKHFRIPIGYHDYLIGVYGDYMTPPPLNKRQTTHNHTYINFEKRDTYDEIYKYLLNEKNSLVK